MTRKPPVLLFATLLACAAAHAAEVRTLRDVVYGSAAGKDLQLDAYLCQSASPAPVVVYIHGGGWARGSRTNVPAYLMPVMAEAGVSVVSVGYRLSGEATWPAQGDDVTRAVQFVRSRAKEWNLDPGRIAAMGQSAGAHLALWVGLHDDRARPGSKDPVERESSRVRAVVNYYGPADFELVRRAPEKHRHNAYRQLFGLPPERGLDALTPAQIRHVSPVSFVSSDDPPVFTAHGTADTTVPVEHAESLIAALKKARVENVNHLLPGGAHGLNNPQPGWPDHRAASIAFLLKHLGRR